MTGSSILRELPHLLSQELHNLYGVTGEIGYADQEVGSWLLNMLT